MTTAGQALGARGEAAVSQHVACPRCGRKRHLTRLPRNFQCADIICKFCGYLAQVKAVTLSAGSEELPRRVPGAAWGPQQEQMLAGIFHGLYFVGFAPAGKLLRIDYGPGHVLQASPEVFEPRKPLGPKAKRAGRTGITSNLTKLPPTGIQRR